MTKQQILAEIAAKIDGQGSAIDAGSALPGILRGILDLIPGEQVNSDWNATEGVAEILNKPTISGEIEYIESIWNEQQIIDVTKAAFADALHITESDVDKIFDAPVGTLVFGLVEDGVKLLKTAGQSTYVCFGVGGFDEGVLVSINRIDGLYSAMCHRA